MEDNEKQSLNCKVLRNTLFQFVDKFVSIITTVFIGAWVIRYLGPEDFGLLSYVISAVVILTSFTRLGLNNIVVRELTKRKSDVSIILSSAFVLKILASVLVYILTVFLLYMYDSKYFVMYVIVSLAIVFQSIEVVSFYFQSKLTAKYTVYANIISTMMVASMRVLLILFGFGVLYFSVIYSLNFFIIGSVLIFYYLKKSESLSIKEMFCSFEKREMLDLLRSSFPIYMASIATAIFMKSDQLMLFWLSTPYQVGVYSVAVSLTTVFYFIPIAISSSFLPALIEKKNISEKNYRAGLQLSINLLLVTALAIAISMSFLSGYIVSILYGDDYSESAILVSLYFWIFVVIAFEAGVSNLIVIESLQKYLMWSTVAGALLNVVLNYILIPIYQSQGAVYATLGSYMLSHYFFYRLFSKTRIIVDVKHRAVKNLFKYTTYKEIYGFVRG